MATERGVVGTLPLRRRAAVTVTRRSSASDVARLCGRRRAEDLGDGGFGGVQQHGDQRALDQLRSTSAEDLLAPRKVGRAGLPSTTLGLIFHAAEHCTRHAGQATSTARILGGSNEP